MSRKHDPMPENIWDIEFPDGADDSYVTYLENKANGFYDQEFEENLEIDTDMLFISENLELLRSIYAEIAEQKEQLEYFDVRFQWVKPTSKNKMERACGILDIRFLEEEEIDVDDDYTVHLAEDLDIPENWQTDFSKYGDMLAQEGIMVLLQHVLTYAEEEVTKFPGAVGCYVGSHGMQCSKYMKNWKPWVKKALSGKYSNVNVLGALSECNFKKAVAWPDPSERPCTD